VFNSNGKQGDVDFSFIVLKKILSCVKPLP